MLIFQLWIFIVFVVVVVIGQQLFQQQVGQGQVQGGRQENAGVFPNPPLQVVGEWWAWGPCTLIDGVSTRTRTRECIGAVPVECHQSYYCGDGTQHIAQGTNGITCNPEIRQWRGWERCSVSCGGGTQFRFREVCLELDCWMNAERQECNNQICPDPDVTIGQWRSWGPCSASCGGGTRQRTREICPSDADCCETSSSDSCNIQTCPPITIGPWSSWERCSVSCGGGTQFRSREICSGVSCRKDSTSQQCSNHKCPDCQGEWTAWIDIDDPNGNGDYEILSDLRKKTKLEICLFPSVIDGRVVAVHTSWQHTGDIVSASQTNGLECVNKNQKQGRSCEDYEVRFCCPKIENRKEVEFVATTFLRTVLTVAGLRGTSGLVSSQSQGKCNRRTYSDSSNILRMIGKACKSGQASQNNPPITKRDVLFLIDESGSVGGENFEKLKRLAQAFVKTFCGDIDVGDKKTRVGILTFDSVQHPQLNFNDAFNKAKILKEIGDMRYNTQTEGYTCLIPALEYVVKSMFTHARGARIAEHGTEQVLILFADGCANCKPYLERSGLLKSLTAQLSQQGISIITLLVGSHPSDCIDQILSLSDGSHCYQGFVANNWDEVDFFIQNIEAATCNTEWRLSAPCVDQ